MAYNFRSVLQNEGMKLCLLLIWMILNVVLFYLSYHKYCAGIQYFYLRKMLGVPLCISRATAYLLYLNCCLVLLPICKSLLTWTRVNIQKRIKGAHRRLFNYGRKFHIIIGIAITILSLTHSFSHVANCFSFYVNFSEEAPEINVASRKEEISMLMFLTKLPVYSGLAMLLILAILVIGSLPCVRRSHYEIFWYSHHLSIAFFGFLAVHGLGGIVKHQTNVEEHYPGCEYMLRMNQSMNRTRCEGKPIFARDPAEAWKWIVVPLALYGINKILQFISRRKPVQVTKAIYHSGNVIELRMKKPGFSALPGQFIRLQCSDISRLQWHPFTLTECPDDEDEEFAVHIKVAGDWTGLLASQLQNMVLVNKSATRIGDSWTISMENISNEVAAVSVDNTVLRLRVDGPYGSPFQDVSRFTTAVIITSGIGVTPFAAVLNHLRHSYRETKSYGKLKKLYFLWVCKAHEDFSWILDILYKTNKLMNRDDEEEMLVARLFVTRSEKISENDPSMFDQRKQWLAAHLQYKRPDWSEELKAIDSNHQRERIGVFFCGAKTIHPIIHKLTNKTSKNKNTMVFHKENF